MNYLKKEILVIKCKLESKKRDSYNKTTTQQQKIIAAHLYEFLKQHTECLRDKIIITAAEITDGLNRPQPSFIVISNNQGKTTSLIIINLFESDKAFSLKTDKLETWPLEQVEKFKLKLLDYVVESILGC